MKKPFIALLLLCLFAAPATAEPRLYVYGGSESDTVDDVTVSDDGRILLIGDTYSHDGTMAGREKNGSSNAAAFALCLDAQGNVLWTLFEDEGTANFFSAAEFQTDGSVLLAHMNVSRADDIEQVELIHIDREGEMISRQSLLSDRDTGGMSISFFAQLTDAGYVLTAYELLNAEAIRSGTERIKRLAEHHYLFNREGQLLGTLESWDEPGETKQVSRRHLLRETELAYTLFSLDPAGNATAIARDFGFSISHAGDSDRFEMLSFGDLLSLEDGGVLGVGHRNRSDVEYACLVRWNAQGEKVMEREYAEGRFQNIVKTEDGFAVTAVSREGAERRWDMLMLDEDGDIRGSVSLGDYDMTHGSVLAVMPDGAIVAVDSTIVDEKDARFDLRVLIIPQEDACVYAFE